MHLFMIIYVHLFIDFMLSCPTCISYSSASLPGVQWRDIACVGCGRQADGSFSLCCAHGRFRSHLCDFRQQCQRGRGTVWCNLSVYLSICLSVCLSVCSTRVMNAKTWTNFQILLIPNRLVTRKGVLMCICCATCLLPRQTVRLRCIDIYICTYIWVSECVSVCVCVCVCV